MARSAAFRDHIADLRSKRDARIHAVTAALAASPALIITASDGKRDLLMVSPDTYPGAAGELRITTFMPDGPLGHTNAADPKKAAERIAEMHWVSISPASEAEVMAWTSAPEFVIGSKRVAIVQAANTMRYRLRGDPEGYRKVAELENRAWSVFDQDPDAAVAIMEGGVRGLPVSNPPRVYRPQKVIGVLQKETRPEFEGSKVIGSPEDVMGAMEDYIGPRATEYFVVLFLNVRNGLVGYTELTEGSTSSVTVHPSGIFREALIAAAAGIVTVHNHPSGDPTPSQDDRALWQ